jgi:hypothetical protein
MSKVKITVPTDHVSPKVRIENKPSNSLADALHKADWKNFVKKDGYKAKSIKNSPREDKKYLKYANEEKIHKPGEGLSSPASVQDIKPEKKKISPSPSHDSYRDEQEHNYNEEDEKLYEEDYGAAYEGVLPEDEEDDMKLKAQLISKLERKIRIYNLNIEIPANAHSKDYELMLNKITYDHGSKTNVEMLKRLFIGINGCFEYLAKKNPKMGLELQGWTQQLEAYIQDGSYEDIFYDLYDEYKEYFEINPLYRLVFFNFSQMLLFSQTQKAVMEILSTSKHNTMKKKANIADLDPPDISEERIKELRKIAENKKEKIEIKDQRKEKEKENISKDSRPISKKSNSNSTDISI